MFVLGLLTLAVNWGAIQDIWWAIFFLQESSDYQLQTMPEDTTVQSSIPLI